MALYFWEAIYLGLFSDCVYNFESPARPVRLECGFYLHPAGQSPLSIDPRHPDLWSIAPTSTNWPHGSPMSRIAQKAMSSTRQIVLNITALHSHLRNSRRCV